jgi:hypothetical protein
MTFFASDSKAKFFDTLDKDTGTAKRYKDLQKREIILPAKQTVEADGQENIDIQ